MIHLLESVMMPVMSINLRTWFKTTKILALARASSTNSLTPSKTASQNYVSITKNTLKSSILSSPMLTNRLKKKQMKSYKAKMSKSFSGRISPTIRPKFTSTALSFSAISTRILWRTSSKITNGISKTKMKFYLMLIIRRSWKKSSCAISSNGNKKRTI